MPRFVKSILGLSHKFIPVPRITSSHMTNELDRIERNVHLKVYFEDDPTEKERSPLYVKSIWRPPPPSIPTEVNRRLAAFSRRIRALFCQQKGRSNLLPL